MGTKEFKVAMKSTNTSGLFQMIVVAEDGEAYKTHASMYYAKEIGFTLTQVHDKYGKRFVGHELTTKLPPAPADVVKELFN